MDNWQFNDLEAAVAEYAASVNPIGAESPTEENSQDLYRDNDYQDIESARDFIDTKSI